MPEENKEGMPGEAGSQENETQDTEETNITNTTEKEKSGSNFNSYAKKKNAEIAQLKEEKEQALLAKDQERQDKLDAEIGKLRGELKQEKEYETARATYGDLVDDEKVKSYRETYRDSDGNPIGWEQAVKLAGYQDVRSPGYAPGTLGSTDQKYYTSKDLEYLRENNRSKYDEVLEKYKKGEVQIQ